MRTESKSIILAESSRLIGQIGNNIVLDLYARVREVEVLARSLASAVEHLPKTEAGFKQVIPPLIDFQQDLSIAGGGVWPEPYRFAADRERRSFFWGRNAAGNLEYYDDYNRSELGYHQEAWYAIGRYTNRGCCVWSASYLDPYSCQPMVTCTSPTFAGEEFSGVVTIDLKLEGLQEFVETWRRKTGGYIFVLDHNNRFITFPNPALIRKTAQENNPSGEFMVAKEFSDREPLFAPLSLAVDQMNREILDQVSHASSFDHDRAQRLSQDSYQIDNSEAALLTAILADPFKSSSSLGAKASTTYLYRNFEIERDFWVKEASTVFLFHVPRTYWKVVIVKPFSEAAMATYSIIQSEKMSSLGQLVAGVAHEVNNPISFIYGNLSHANTYSRDLLELIRLYQQHFPNPPIEIQQCLEACDFDFIVSDLPKILTSMKVGADRIRQIVLSLRNFARMDEAELKPVNIHDGLESTLLLLDSRLKPHPPKHPGIQITKHYGSLPQIECYPGPLNQVFMNILINAIDALDEAVAKHYFHSSAPSPSLPEITISTRRLAPDRALITISDNGTGIPKTLQQRLFDPFFTTKPVGKGTGLGLAICHQIITEKHQGEIRCLSSVGQGTEFQIEIPIREKDKG
jgi:two-component system NtrC family sensor kinase